ncbi:MAG: lipid-A-disaccharide synthase [Ignavibacteria bacterium]|nr:lipid-A-disaccharide synthase [Bacteroidota bacterium]MSQ45682.1 lipid-A-disaccharide synthase [Ignavibacteria bacterium]
MKRIMIITGEASGDIHGAEVVRELKTQNPHLDIFGVGGNNMQTAGMELIQHIDTISLMGFSEVIRHLHKFILLKRKIINLLINRRPDIVLLIDFPGFNIKIANEAKKLNIKVAYYIAPQLWAWKPKRINVLKRLVAKMFVIFHFEEKIFQEKGIPVEFVGHPLLDELPKRFDKELFYRNYGLTIDRPIITLLPGSRENEIDNMFPVMLETIKEFLKTHSAHIIVGVAPTININKLREMSSGLAGLHFIQGDSNSVIQVADAVIVTSGTATLETAYFGKPMIVLYKVSQITYRIAKIFVKIPYISLVNIVLGKEVVKEILQDKLQPKIILEELIKIMDDKNYNSEMRENLLKTKLILGEPGAAKKVANGLLQLIK